MGILRSGPPSKVKAPPIPVLLFWSAVILGVLMLFFAGIRTGVLYGLLTWTRRAGWEGVVIGILVMTVFSIIPTPSELISIGLMNVYGVGWGALYSWTGGILGALVGALLARAVARPFAMRAVGRYLPWLGDWVQQRGALGFLAIRFIPLVPYHFVNYMGGILGVPTWSFVWTTAVGTLPFQIGLAGVYAGVAYGTALPLILGGLVLLTLFVSGWISRRTWMPNIGPDEALRKK